MSACDRISQVQTEGEVSKQSHSVSKTFPKQFFSYGLVSLDDRLVDLTNVLASDSSLIRVRHFLPGLLRDLGYIQITC